MLPPIGTVRLDGYEYRLQSGRTIPELGKEDASFGPKGRMQDGPPGDRVGPGAGGERNSGDKFGLTTRRRDPDNVPPRVVGKGAFPRRGPGPPGHHQFGSVDTPRRVNELARLFGKTYRIAAARSDLPQVTALHVVNAIQRPSGDQAGANSCSGKEFGVSLLGAPSGRSITQTLPTAWKASLAPSGDAVCHLRNLASNGSSGIRNGW